MYCLFPSLSLSPPSLPLHPSINNYRIKTGWSTISNHIPHQTKLTHSELKHIQQVLERAHAVEHVEEIRIGWVCTHIHTCMFGQAAAANDVGN